MTVWLKVVIGLACIGVLLALAPLVYVASNVVPYAPRILFSRYPQGESELFRIYIANYRVAKEKLVLKEDGTFAQEVTVKANSQVATSRGSWRYNATTGYVTFRSGFMLAVDGSGNLKPDYARPAAGLVILPAESFFGRVQLGSDERVVYERVNSAM